MLDVWALGIVFAPVQRMVLPGHRMLVDFNVKSTAPNSFQRLGLVLRINVGKVTHYAATISRIILLSAINASKQASSLYW